MSRRLLIGGVVVVAVVAIAAMGLMVLTFTKGSDGMRPARWLERAETPSPSAAAEGDEAGAEVYRYETGGERDLRMDLAKKIPATEAPAFSHEEVEVTDHLETARPGQAAGRPGSGQDDAIKDIPLGGTGVVGELGLGGGAAGRLRRPESERLAREKQRTTTIVESPIPAAPADPGPKASEVAPRQPMKEVRTKPFKKEPEAKKSEELGLITRVRPPRPRQPRPSSKDLDRLTDRLEQADPTRSYGPYDELWVIEKPKRDPNVMTSHRELGEIQLRARVPGEEKEIPLPLKHTEVKARVSAFVATVDVTQQYHNPYGVKIEAVYVFPLPHNSAVTDFVMVIGDRRIRGVIREREQARRIYKQARRAGHVAALLTQERPNIFTQRVANIEPKKQIDIQISYFNTLTYSRGEYEFVFPMVVGPRFNPAGSTGGVGAVGHGHKGSSGQRTEVQYLKPGTRSGHDIGLTVDIDAGVEIEKVRSTTHAIEMKRVSESKMRVNLSRLDTLPNKDFVLRYRVAGRNMKTAVMTHRGEKTNTFAMVLQPPGDLMDLPRMPREMVFVLDCSGSMRGWPLKKAKEAMRRCLSKLGPDDTFQIIRFSNRASQLGSRPVAATKSNVARGLRYLETLRGTGGTMMIEGIKAALDFRHDPKRFRVVSFMTDGYIGNETQIFRETKKRLGASRIFSFGVGTSVNRHLLAGLARMGQGAAAYVNLSDSADEAVDLFYERCSRPALADIEIDWGGMKVKDVYPRKIRDLFVGRPVVITGRYEGEGKTAIRVKGRCGTRERSYAMNIDLDDESARHAGIGKVWARTKLAHLADVEAMTPSGELKDEITQVSLEHRVICNYTAFLAVDTLRVTEGNHGISVAQPVPVPAGVRYETTVSE